MQCFCLQLQTPQAGTLSPDNAASPTEDFFATPAIDQKQRRAVEKREAAAQFINCTVVGPTPVPHTSDEAFRAALADGVILCRLINCLKPGSIPHIMENANGSPGFDEFMQTFENVANFLEAVRRFTPEAVFSAADLEAAGEKYVFHV